MQLSQTVLKNMQTLFAQLPEDSWYQNDGENPAIMWNQRHNRGNMGSTDMTDADLKECLSRPCCFGAKIVAYLDLTNPEFLNGQSGYHHYKMATKGLANLFGCTEFHIHRALIEAGAPYDPFDSDEYKVPQPEVLDRLIKLEKMPPLTDFNFNSLGELRNVTEEFKELDFTKSVFEYTDFNGGRFKDCTFDGVTFEHADLDYCQFDGSSFKKASFDNTEMEASFDNTEMDQTVFVDVDFNRTTFTCCPIRGSTFINCSFSYASFERCEFRGTEFERCSFRGLQLGDPNNNGLDCTTWTGCKISRNLTKELKSFDTTIN